MSKLRDVRYKFAVSNNLPERYQKILNDLDAHSDDEYIAEKDVYTVKKLVYRSEVANEFFARLDEEMLKSDQIDGKRPQRRRRIRPKHPVESALTRPLRNFPIDFFDPEWFNNLPDSKKTMVTDSQKVVFLPKGHLSFRPIVQKDEKMSDKKFVSKYWDQKIEPYNLDHEVGVSEDESNQDDPDDSSYAGSNIDLEDTSGDEYKEDAGVEEEEVDEAEDLKNDRMHLDEESEDEARARRWDESLVAGPSEWDDYQ